MAGAIGCLVLALTLPMEAVLGGLLVIALGASYRFWRQRTAGI